jgi:hypothetical protein
MGLDKFVDESRASIIMRRESIARRESKLYSDSNIT